MSGRGNQNQLFAPSLSSVYQWAAADTMAAPLFPSSNVKALLWVCPLGYIGIWPLGIAALLMIEVPSAHWLSKLFGIKNDAGKPKYIKFGLFFFGLCSTSFHKL